ncbi:NtaA/DmoA family FMN-dependent monooxygenase [Cohnella phaseoli]|uniref:FMN-dependent oxidoreductase (Nitrilotriacetate monooxygenase family) n=1 Tax=Cohnella phaseoli TaxID=456490 RepID=A0A3D9IU66_9BACL|nr:NtaA/DmoA family FMN-dependent monooxygenase [Cohnella phaseoli]RED65343.1 FMN-dependent oxidoreductase (nitrilotriacetate monooxygenase family) [Cohnella phaseoli]
MTAKRKQLKLATTLIAPRAASGGWRHPGAEAYAKEPISYYAELARKAEDGKLDYLFQPDQYRVSATTDREFQHNVNVWPEPVTLLTAMAAFTKRIGLAATISTTYNEPYHVARMMATLDHLSGGRASWNIVQSIGELEAPNFKNDHRPKQEERDTHSAAFVDVVKELWDSWEDDAIIADKEAGIFADPGKIHIVGHESKWFSVKGPLNVARPTQGYPVLIQAGQSDSFKERAAQNADVIFTMLNDLTQARQFYKDVKQRLSKYGRTSEELLIMPGLHLHVGTTMEEAREKQQYLTELERFDTRLDRISFMLGIEITEQMLDGPLPVAHEGLVTAKYKRNKELADRQGWTTVRQLHRHLEEIGGHLTLIGTPVQIADRLEEWLVNEGADGFTYIPNILPSGLDDLVDLVIPELQNRGLFRKAYEHTTLRGNLGLSRPRNRYAKAD